MDIKDHALHHERANTKRYEDGDHRVHHEKCDHTRFRDRDGALTHGLCLDCGSEIKYGTWEVTVPDHLSDEELIEHRTWHNRFWYEGDPDGANEIMARLPSESS